jgi:hypothetical protein
VYNLNIIPTILKYKVEEKLHLRVSEKEEGEEWRLLGCYGFRNVGSYKSQTA